MKRNVTWICLLLMLCSWMPAAAAGRPAPVPGVMRMFDAFNELEESTRGGEWDEAIATVKKIEADYRRLVPSLKGTVDGKVLQRFGFLITDFKKKVASKDSEKVEKPFRNLQSIFFDIMDYYEYPAPPVLMVAARNIDEAGEVLARGEVDDAGEEMEEIAGFRPRIEKALAAEGVAADKITAFFALVAKGEEQAEDNDAAGLAATLERLAAFMAPYAAAD